MFSLILLYFASRRDSVVAERYMSGIAPAAPLPVNTTPIAIAKPRPVQAMPLARAA